MPVTLNLIWVFCLFKISKKLVELMASLNQKHQEADCCLSGVNFLFDTVESWIYLGYLRVIFTLVLPLKVKKKILFSGLVGFLSVHVFV